MKIRHRPDRDKGGAHSFNMYCKGNSHWEVGPALCTKRDVGWFLGDELIHHAEDSRFHKILTGAKREQHRSYQP